MDSEAGSDISDTKKSTPHPPPKSSSDKFKRRERRRKERERENNNNNKSPKDSPPPTTAPTSKSRHRRRPRTTSETNSEFEPVPNQLRTKKVLKRFKEDVVEVKNSVFHERGGSEGGGGDNVLTHLRLPQNSLSLLMSNKNNRPFDRVVVNKEDTKKKDLMKKLTIKRNSSAAGLHEFYDNIPFFTTFLLLEKVSYILNFILTGLLAWETIFAVCSVVGPNGDLNEAFIKTYYTILSFLVIICTAGFLNRIDPFHGSEQLFSEVILQIILSLCLIMSHFITKSLLLQMLECQTYTIKEDTTVNFHLTYSCGEETKGTIYKRYPVFGTISSFISTISVSSIAFYTHHKKSNGENVNLFLSKIIKLGQRRIN